MPAADRPLVDPRIAEDLATRLRDRARETLPAWRPSPEGDVGTALQEVASRFAAQVVDRVNRVPTHAKRSFLERAGMTPLAARPARVTVAFGLRVGETSAVVPAGTQVEAPTTPDRPAVVFETVRDLTVLPSRVAVAEVLDPVWDRVTDVLTATTALGVPALAGLVPAPHRLHLTSAVLTALEERATVTVTVDLESASSRDETVAMVQSLQLLAVRATGEAPCAAPGGEVAGRDTAVTLTVSAGPGEVDALALSLTGPLSDHPCAEDDLVRRVTLEVLTAARLPGTVVVDGAPTDPTSSFLPFGEVPGTGSELAIADPLLAYDGAAITLALQLDPGVPKSVTLAWEWHDGTTWQPLSGVVDNTGVLAGDGTITFTSPGCPAAKVAGVRGHWVRARLTAGGYGAPARYVPKDPNNLGAGLQVQPGTGDLDAPRILTLTLAAALRDDAPVAVRRSHRHADTAVDRPVALGLDRLPEPEASPGQTLLLGLDGDLGPHPVSIHVTTADPPPAPRGVQPAQDAEIPLTWEYLGLTGWRPLTVTDGTHAFSRSGMVSFLAPEDLATTALAGHPALQWLRARAETQTTASGSPRVAVLTANAVEAVAGESVAWEDLGASDGRTDGRLRLARTPVLAGQELYAREVEPPQGEELRALLAAEGASAVAERTDPRTGRTALWVRWHEVASFTTSGPRDRHYTVDRAAGVIRLGVDGHGLAAPRGTAFAARYRFGGGASGNVPAGAVVRMRTAVAPVSSVHNVVAADGGADAESMDMYERRAPAAVRHRGRAITATDVLWHTRELAGTRVARCMVPSGVSRGEMAVVVVPQSDGPAPAPTSTLLALLEEELERRIPVDLALRGGVRVLAPSYRQVTVVAEVEPEHPEQADAVKARALAALDRFLHALSGGPEGTGWPLGRAVYESEIGERLVDVAGVRTVRSVRLVPSALTQRLGFRSPVLVPLGLAVGSPVGLGGTGHVWTIDQPVPAGTAVDGVTVRGVTEGDRLHVVVDGEVTGVVAPGSSAVVVGFEPRPGSPAGVALPAGSALADGTGRVLGLVRRTAVTAAGPLHVLVAPLEQPLHAGQHVTLVHAAALTVTGVDAAHTEATGLVSLRGDDTASVVPGATLGVLGHALRVPANDVISRSPSVTVLSTRLWRPEDRVDLLESDDGAAAEVVAVRPVDDVVHLDRSSLARSGTHVIRMVQGPRRPEQ
jgi:predicted phage baseplate assembly protein